MTQAFDFGYIVRPVNKALRGGTACQNKFCFRGLFVKQGIDDFSVNGSVFLCGNDFIQYKQGAASAFYKQQRSV